MPWDDQGLFLTLAINAAVTAAMLGLLLALHRRAGLRAVYHPRHADLAGTHELYGVRSPLSLVWVLGIPEWLARCGGDYAALLYLQTALAKAVGLYAVLALVMLVPIDVTDNYREVLAKANNASFTPGIEDLTVFNVHPGSWRLYFHGLASLVLSLLIWRVVYKCVSLLYDFKHHVVPDPVQWSTALMVGPPCSAPQQAVTTYFPLTVLPPKALACISIPRRHVARYEGLVRRREALAMKLHAATEHAAAHRSPVLVRPPPRWRVWAPKADAVAVWQAQLQAVDKELLQVVQGYKMGPPAGPLFLTFPSVQEHLAFCHWRAASSLTVGQHHQAPLPADVLWQNLHHGRCYRSIGRLLTFSLFTVMLLFWTVPVAFLSSLDQIATIPLVGEGLHYILTMNHTVAGLVQAYLPVLVLALFNLVLPLICRQLASLAAPHTRSSWDRLTFKENFLFMFCVLMLTSVFGAGIQGIAVLLQTLTPENVLNLLVRIVSPRVGFFMARVISATFIEMWFPALQVGALIVTVAKQFAHKGGGAEGPAEVPTLDLWQEYVDLLLTLSVVVVFGVTLPVIPIFGVVYFYVKVLRDQYLLTHVFPKQPAMQLRILPLALHFVLLSLDFHQWGMLGLLAVKQQWICFGLYAVLPLLSLLAHCLLHAARPLVFLTLEEVASGQKAVPPPDTLAEWVLLALDCGEALLPLQEPDPEATAGEAEGANSSRISPLVPTAEPRKVVRVTFQPLERDAYLSPLEKYSRPEAGAGEWPPPRKPPPQPLQPTGHGVKESNGFHSLGRGSPGEASSSSNL
eukprot:EG_transcript_2534